MDIIKELKEDFKSLFQEDNNIKVFFAPGRVNMIGEYTDFNGGYVFPCALSFGTYAAAIKRDDKKIRMYSKNFKEIGIIELIVDDIKYEKEHDWANYPKGVVKVFKDNGYAIDTGFDILFFGNIPNGAGLSSSASIEMATGVVLNKLFNLNIDMISMVKMGQKAENEFIGVNCGIMDQFAIGVGKKENAVLLNCNTLEYKYSHLDLKDASIVISNTNKRRGLADSKYNERRSEGDRALVQLQNKLNIKYLCDLSKEDFEENKHLITNEIDRKRAKHVVYENIRTLEAVNALESGNLNRFGELMNQSHISLRDDYEVTGKELDTLVSFSLDQEGTIGSRMTGAGFGGCTVSIVKNNKLDEFIINVGKKYKEVIGYEASFYIASIGDGARELI